MILWFPKLLYAKGKMGKEMKQRELLETEPPAKVLHVNKTLGILSVRKD